MKYLSAEDRIINVMKYGYDNWVKDSGSEGPLRLTIKSIMDKYHKTSPKNTEGDNSEALQTLFRGIDAEFYEDRCEDGY
jgi:hypothetical protein|tara:strand:- start:924 stop:1160 length:237 start_codon:yes stop_codon:yes gene_type:complete